MSYCFSDSRQLYPNTNVLKGSFVPSSHSEKLGGSDINKHTCRYFHPKKGHNFVYPETHVFLLWEKAEVPRESPNSHVDKLYTEKSQGDSRGHGGDSGTTGRSRFIQRINPNHISSFTEN